MIITLVGMSNCGKTHWSKRLEEEGWTRIGCDDLIARRLLPLADQSGQEGGTSLAGWLGQPCDVGFRDREKKCVEAEQAVMHEVIARAKNETGDVVIDTSGSVIYTDEATRQALRDLSCVVYLKPASIISSP